jgi:hypothetical protein
VGVKDVLQLVVILGCAATAVRVGEQLPFRKLKDNEYNHSDRSYPAGAY